MPTKPTKTAGKSTKSTKPTKAARPAAARSSAPTATRSLLTADPAPKTGAPATPQGFVPPKNALKGGNTPTTQQVRDALDVAGEVDNTGYSDDFGPRAPDPQTLAASLQLAKSWSDELDAAQRWLAYVRAQYDTAWNDALKLTKKLQPEFELAVAHDASLAKKYRQTGGFIAVRRVSATKGAATRAKKKKTDPVKK